MYWTSLCCYVFSISSSLLERNCNRMKRIFWFYRIIIHSVLFFICSTLVTIFRSHSMFTVTNNRAIWISRFGKSTYFPANIFNLHSTFGIKYLLLQEFSQSENVAWSRNLGFLRMNHRRVSHKNNDILKSSCIFCRNSRFRFDLHSFVFRCFRKNSFLKDWLFRKQKQCEFW